jgi:hypothetical protein
VLWTEHPTNLFSERGCCRMSFITLRSLHLPLESVFPSAYELTLFHRDPVVPFFNFYRGADKSLARPGRKQATVTEGFEFQISCL